MRSKFLGPITAKETTTHSMNRGVMLHARCISVEETRGELSGFDSDSVVDDIVESACLMVMVE